MSGKKKEKVKVRKEVEDKFATVSGETKDLLLKEKELREQLAGVKRDLRAKQDEKDKVMAKVRAENKTVFDGIDTELEQLREQKDKKLAQLTRDDLSKSSLRHERSTLIDKLKLADFDLYCAKQEKQKIRDTTHLVMDEVVKLQKKQTALQRTKYKSIGEVNSVQAELEAKEKKALKNDHDTLLKDIRRKMHDLDIARENVKASDIVAKQLKEATAKVDPLVERQKENEAECAAFEKMVQERSNALKAFNDAKMPKEPVQDEDSVKEIKEDLKKVRKEIDRVTKEKHDAAASKQKFDDSAIKELVLERNVIEKELDQISAKIPEKVVTVDMDFIDALIGAGGATINQLAKDFSCIIDVYRSTRRVVIRGDDDLEPCAEAIEAILSEAKANRLEEVAPYDSNITGELVRNLGRMEKTSGARITLLRDSSKIKYVGSQEGIQAAKELIAEFTLNSHREEIEIGEEVARCVRGKVLMGIQTGTGARSVSLREKSIVCWGKKECVVEAVKQLKELVDAMSESKVEVTVPKGVMMRDVAGPGGKHVRAIEDDTKTYIIIKNPILVMGSKEGTQKAKQLLRSLFNEVRKDEALVPYPTNIHFMLIRRTRPETKEEERAVPEPEAEAEPEVEAEAEAEAEVEEKPETEEKPEAEAAPADAEEEAEGGEEGVEAAGGEPEEREEGEPEEKEEGEKAVVKKKRDRRRRKKKEPALCFLERVMRETGCETVSARREAGKILLVGKRDAVKNAKVMLEQFLEDHKLESEKVPCAAALIRYLSVRRGKERPVLMSLRAVEGVDDVYPDPEKSRVELTGSKAGLEAAKEMLQKVIDEKTPCLGSFDFERGRAGAIYGTKGSTINSIEKDCKAVLHVDKAKSTVEILASTPEGLDSARELLEKAIEADKEKNPVPKTGKGFKGFDGEHGGKGYKGFDGEHGGGKGKGRRGDGPSGKGSKGDAPRGGKGAKSGSKA